MQNFVIVVGNTRPVVKITLAGRRHAARDRPAGQLPRRRDRPRRRPDRLHEGRASRSRSATTRTPTRTRSSRPAPTATGTVTPNRTTGHTGTLYVFTVFEASYTDAGNGVAPGADRLRQRRLQPAHAGHVACIRWARAPASTPARPSCRVPGHWLMFRNYDLAKIGAITMSTSSRGSGGTMEIRADSPTGPLVGSAVMPEHEPRAVAAADLHHDHGADHQQAGRRARPVLRDEVDRPGGAPARRRRSRRSSSTRTRWSSTRRCR